MQVYNSAKLVVIFVMVFHMPYLFYLFRCNFSDMEIEMFFAKYDLDGDRTLDVSEIKTMLKDLEGLKSGKSLSPVTLLALSGSLLVLVFVFMMMKANKPSAPKTKEA